MQFGLGVGVGDAVGDGLGVGVGTAVGPGVGVGDGDGDGDGLGVGCGVGDRDGRLDRDAVDDPGPDRERRGRRHVQAVTEDEARMGVIRWNRHVTATLAGSPMSRPLGNVGLGIGDGMSQLMTSASAVTSR